MILRTPYTLQVIPIALMFPIWLKESNERLLTSSLLIAVSSRHYPLPFSPPTFICLFIFICFCFADCPGSWFEALTLLKSIFFLDKRFFQKQSKLFVTEFMMSIEKIFLRLQPISYHWDVSTRIRSLKFYTTVYTYFMYVWITVSMTLVYLCHHISTWAVSCLWFYRLY